MTEHEFKFAVEQVLEAYGRNTVAASTVRAGISILTGRLRTVQGQRDRLLVSLKEVLYLSDRKHEAWDEAHAVIAEVEEA